MPDFTVLESGHRWYERPADITVWKAGRKDYLGASEVAAIMGVNPYQTAYQVWLSKTGQTLPPMEEDNLHLFMGRHQEPGIAAWYELQEQRELYDDKRVWVHPTLDFLRCNLDRIAKPKEQDLVDGLTTGLIVECKSVGLMAKHKWVHGFPEQYFVQVQTQLLCAPYMAADLAVVVGGNMDYMTFRILPNAEIQALIVKNVTEFWEYVKSGVEPPLTAMDLSKVASIDDSVAEADQAALLDHQLALRLSSEKKSIENQYEAVMDRLKEYLGKRETLTYHGMPLLTYKTQDGKKTVDAKKLEKEQPTIYSQYVKVGKPFRVARLKEVTLDVQRDESTGGHEGPSAEPGSVGGSANEHGVGAAEEVSRSAE